MSISDCQEKCASSLHLLNETDVWITHQRFKHLGHLNQRKWVLDYLHTNTCRDTNEITFCLCGKTVCLRVWLAVLGLSKSRFYEIRKAYLDGSLSIEKVSNPILRRSKTYEAISWMRHYFEQVGDHMPDRMAIHLPSFLTNSAVYDRMKEEFEADGHPVISQSHFFNLRRTEFPHVSIPKVCKLNVKMNVNYVIYIYTNQVCTAVQYYPKLFLCRKIVSQNVTRALW